MIEIIDIILIGIIVVCIITDLKNRKIYNKVIYPTFIFAITYHFITGGWNELMHSLIGTLVGLALLFIPYYFNKFGAGDIKLLALVGALKGPGFVFHTGIYMGVIGAIIALCYVVLSFGGPFKILSAILTTTMYRKRPQKLKDLMKSKMPYAIPICGGALFCLLFEGYRLW
ncbi:UNVERIFIED_CONTAM: prepilin peptidase CpaA [Acetivibrio alkalicellulosi]